MNVWRVYQTPNSVEQALRLLEQGGPGARIVAGSTDLLVEMRRTAGCVPALVDVTRIGGLDQIRRDDDGLIHIGPTATHNQAAASALLADCGLPLALACSQVGTPQVRNRGTITGNLVTASPANDTITALSALDARLTVRSLRGERSMSFAEFYQGVRRTALHWDELVIDIVFPALKANQRGIFLKLGLRRTNAISVANAAAVLTFERDIVTGARIALGSVFPTILRVPDSERALLGGPLNEERMATAADLAAQAVAPITDVRGGAEYRRTATRFLVRRALAALRNGAGPIVAPRTLPRLWGKTDGHFPAWRSDSFCHNEDGNEPIEGTVNGHSFVVHGANGKRLLDMLREDLGLTGTKEGCGEGECGACTVWLDGIAGLACLVAAPRAHGAHIVTVEGMVQDDTLHPLQQAMIDQGAVQCGYCTPGFVMAGASLLEEVGHPTREQAKVGLSGNLCRCTGYYKILRAVENSEGDGCGCK
jgi:xanthine dehydrogenase iron-sulfur cluster and FAD-binding subunit A